jgi:hypothetical protein
MIPKPKIVKKNQARINYLANQRLLLEFRKRYIHTCEAKLKGCKGYLFTSFHHRHKRNWYKIKGNKELLGDFNQVILVCANCHSILEGNKELTENLFKQLRK